jgi:hypothetical protein
MFVLQDDATKQYVGKSGMVSDLQKAKTFLNEPGARIAMAFFEDRKLSCLKAHLKLASDNA